MASFGDTEPWGQAVWDVRLVASPYDVYLWRARITGMNLSTPEQALLIVQAIGRKIDMFDIRGIALNGAGGDYSVDVVYTARTHIAPPIWGWDTAEDITKFVTEDSDVRASFPSLAVVSAGLLELTGPPASKDFWLSRAVVWDKLIGPLRAFSAGEGVYQGIADDGPNLKPWKSGYGFNERPPSAKPGESSGTGIWVGVVTVGAIAAIAWFGSGLLIKQRS